MRRKLKLFIVTMLGFSTACSSVKNAPKEKEPRKDRDSLVVVGGQDAEDAPRVIVMYGVRPPLSDSLLRQVATPLPEDDSRADDK